MIDDSLKQQALDDVNKAEAKQMFTKRITKAKQIRTEFLTELKDNGLDSPSYSQEPYETTNHETYTSRSVIDIRRIGELPSRNINVTMTMESDGEVHYRLGSESNKIGKSQLIRILKIMKE